MQKITIEKSLTVQTKILGLDLVDIAIIGSFLGLSLSIYHNPLIDLAMSIALYIFIFLFKLGKPMNYTTVMLYYAMSHAPYRFYPNDIESITVITQNKTMKATQKADSLASKINIWAVEDNCVVSLNEEYTLGFEINSFNIFLLDDYQIDPILNSVKIMLDGIKEYYNVQSIYSVDFTDNSMLDEYEKKYEKVNLSEIDRLILNSKILKLREQPIRTIKIYLFITIPRPGLMKQKLFNVAPTNNKFKAISTEERRNILSEVNSIDISIRSQIEGLGCEIKRMNDDELNKYIYEHLNPRRKNLIGIQEAIDEYTTREQLALSPARPSWDHFEVDGVYYAGINLKLPPEAAYLFEMQNILNLQFSYKFMINSYVPRQEKIIGNLKTKLKRSLMQVQNSSSKNFEETQKLKEENDILSEVTASTQTLFKTSMCVIVGDTDKEILKSKCDEIIAAFSSLSNAQAVRYNPDHERLFLSFLPGHGLLNLNSFVIKSTALKHWFLLWKNWVGTKNIQTLYKTVHNDLVKFDYDDTSVQAKNKLLSGTVGSGKSFTAIYNIINFLITDSNNEVITIDVNPDYKYLSTVFNGKYIKIDPNVDTLSLFPKKIDFYSEESRDKYDTSLMEFLRSILELLVSEKDPPEPLRNSELMIIENCIRQAYDNINDDEDFPILSQIESELQDYIGKDNDDRISALTMAKSLAFWTNGVYSNLLNKKTDGIAINERLVSFDLSMLMQNAKLADIVFFVLNFMIVRKMYTKKKGRFLINLDEFNSFANNKTAAKTIEYVFSAGRKFKAEITAISQSPKHFIKHKAFDSILNNVHTKYYLNINEGTESLEVYGLTARERQVVGNLRSVPGYYSPMLFTYKSRREVDDAVILKIEPSPIEYWICTNNKDDYAIRDEYKHLSVIEQLKTLASKYPNGHIGKK